MNRRITDLLKRISLFVFVIFSAFLLYINVPFIFLQHNTCVYIHKQESFNEFIKDITLKTRHVSPIILRIYTKFSHLDRHLEVGEYCFTDRASIVSILGKIGRAGRELRKFTLVDGWTYQEMIQHLALAPSLSNKEILNDNHALASALQLSENNLEGQFYPDTYYYTYPDTALEILQQAHDLMAQKIHLLYQDPQTHQFFQSPYELLIAASIIQKESNNPIDQLFVASVMVNRMKQHMRLQMDPTVIYGLGKTYSLPLKKEDLKNDTPYNTYLHMGLPPTPICMPGETALYAAAHPKDSSYLYFVSKKNGTHQFSETLKEQTLAINYYLLHQSSEDQSHENQ